MYHRVYLAGPITGLTYDDGVDWRQYACRRLYDHYGLCALSPLRSKQYLRPLGVLEENNCAIHPLSTDQGIVARDRFDVMTCDAVLMHLLGASRVSIGTMIEVGWADAWRKPIVLVMEDADSIHEHGMLRNIAGFRVSDLDAGIDLIATLLGQDIPVELPTTQNPTLQERYSHLGLLPRC